MFLPAGNVTPSDPAHSERLTTALPFFRPVPGLERGNVAQALLDVAAVFFCLLFIFTTAVSIPVAVFLLFFIQF